MFGKAPKLGLTSHIPQEFLEAVSNGILGENMNELLNQPTETNVANSKLNEISKETEILMNQFIEHSSEENTEITRTINTEESFNERLPIHDRDNSQTFESEVTWVNGIEQEQNDNQHPAVKFRQAASKNIFKQATRMIFRSNKKLVPLAIEDNMQTWAENYILKYDN
ncbi:hypothetical protein QE152_g10266 [Popillia japonica]|uniref:Uncharacterized protein n=1 Tax=Popillia japonica TaxID=7064 RepID=A0AAW1LU43_POPJA